MAVAEGAGKRACARWRAGTGPFPGLLVAALVCRKPKGPGNRLNTWVLNWSQGLIPQVRDYEPGSKKPSQTDVREGFKIGCRGWI